ncbi:MAG: hypothetical protein QXK35_07140 [Nitrososphaerales archaeon]
MRFLIRLKKSRREFKVDKSFTTRSIITKRTIEISEAFGLGIDEEKVFDVYKGFIIEINPGDVIYITGDSGGGKSTLLKELADQMSNCDEFKEVLIDKFIEPIIIKTLADKPIIDCVGKDTSEAINILSMAGLNDAFLFLRKYSELSDGQKYRFRIAWMMDQSNIKTWVFDDFTALLDRITARVVAYCVQKLARRLGKTLLIATTHKDLLEDLNPNIHIDKRFGSEVYVKRFQYKPRECSILKDVKIIKGSRKDYEALEQFHYRSYSPLPTFVNKFYVAKIDNEIIGVIAYGSPYWNIKARNLILPHYNIKPTSKKLKLLNCDFTRIWRVIIAPKYRSIGLGVKLVKETLPLINKPYVEVYAVMAKYNPFFEKAGMIPIKTDFDKNYGKILEKLQKMGFDIQLLSSKKHNLDVINKLSEDGINELKRIIIKNFLTPRFRGKSLIPLVMNNDKDAMAEALRRHRLNPLYLIWKNPKFKDYPNPIL